MQWMQRHFWHGFQTIKRMWWILLSALISLIELTLYSKSYASSHLTCDGSNLNFNIINNLTTIKEWPEIYERNINGSNDGKIKLQNQISFQMKMISGWLKAYKKTILVLCSENSSILDNFDTTFFSSLELLRITYSDIKEIQVNPFSQLYKLEYLDLSNNNIETIASNAFPVSLKELVLNYNNLTSLANLSYLKNLEHIKLQNNPNILLPKWPTLSQILPMKFNFLQINQGHLEKVFCISSSDVEKCLVNPHVFLNETSFSLMTYDRKICVNLTELCLPEKNNIHPTTEKLISSQKALSTEMIVIIFLVLLIVILLLLLLFLLLIRKIRINNRNIYSGVKNNAQL